MPLRKNHYRQLFPAETGSSHNAAGTTATPSRVPETSGTPTPVHPVEPAAQRPPMLYAQLDVSDILGAPGHELLPRLDNRGLPNTYWFGIHTRVGRSVADTIKAYFEEPHYNWSSVHPDVVETWFKCFAHKWHWEVGLTGEVRKAFKQKAKLRLNNTVSDWKRGWEASGDEAKPPYLSFDVWNGLKAYWIKPSSQLKAASCAASRRTVGEDGLPAVLPHTSGQTPFAGRRLQMANGGELPPMTRVFEETHKKKDGSFVNPRAETIYNDVQARIADRQSQLPPQLSPGGSSVQSTAALTTAQMDEIYEEVAPKKKGRVLGMGSIQHTPVASSSRIPFADPVELQNRLDTTQNKLENAQAEITTLRETTSFMMSVFELLGEENPNVAAMMRQRFQGQQPSTSAQPDPLSAHRARVHESTDEELFGNLGVDE